MGVGLSLSIRYWVDIVIPFPASSAWSSALCLFPHMGLSYVLRSPFHPSDTSLASLVILFDKTLSGSESGALGVSRWI